MTNQPIVPKEIRTVFDGRMFKVQIETLTLPKGHELKAEIVRHPGSVVLIPMTDAGEIVLVKQYRAPIGRWAWELPAGTLEPGEEVEKAAVRECHEEIGLIPDRLERLGAFFPTPGYCDEEMTFFKASALRKPREGEHAEADEDEDIDAQVFSLAQIKSMIATGEIIDMKTVAGVALI